MKRDFTLNGLMYDLEANRLYDFVGGIDDIHNKVGSTLLVEPVLGLLAFGPFSA